MNNMKQKFIIKCREIGSYLSHINKKTVCEKDNDGNDIFTEYGEAVFSDLKNAKTFDTFTEARLWAKKLTSDCIHHVFDKSSQNFDVVLCDCSENGEDVEKESITWWSTSDE